MGKNNMCENCGADYALHQYETERCPKNGREETREGFKQQWSETRYCHNEDVFENLIQTIERTAQNNTVTITNVALWAKSWREERVGKKI